MLSSMRIEAYTPQMLTSHSRPIGRKKQIENPNDNFSQKKHRLALFNQLVKAFKSEALKTAFETLWDSIESYQVIDAEKKQTETPDITTARLIKAYQCNFKQLIDEFVLRPEGAILAKHPALYAVGNLYVAAYMLDMFQAFRDMESDAKSCREQLNFDKQHMQALCRTAADQFQEAQTQVTNMVDAADREAKQYANEVVFSKQGEEFDQQCNLSFRNYHAELDSELKAFSDQVAKDTNEETLEFLRVLLINRLTDLKNRIEQVTLLDMPKSALMFSRPREVERLQTLARDEVEKCEQQIAEIRKKYQSLKLSSVTLPNTVKEILQGIVDRPGFNFVKDAEKYIDTNLLNKFKENCFIADLTTKVTERIESAKREMSFAASSSVEGLKTVHDFCLTYLPAQAESKEVAENVDYLKLLDDKYADLNKSIANAYKNYLKAIENSEAEIIKNLRAYLQKQRADKQEVIEQIEDEINGLKKLNIKAIAASNRKRQAQQQALEEKKREAERADQKQHGVEKHLWVNGVVRSASPMPHSPRLILRRPTDEALPHELKVESKPFHLPQATPYALSSGVSAGIGLPLLAIAIAGLVSNPAGWMVGMFIAGAALIGGAIVLGKRAHNRYVKNKMLAKHAGKKIELDGVEVDAQEKLFTQNENLKAQRSPTRVPKRARQFMMKFGVVVNRDTQYESDTDSDEEEQENKHEIKNVEQANDYVDCSVVGEKQLKICMNYKTHRFFLVKQGPGLSKQMISISEENYVEEVDEYKRGLG